MKDQIHQMLGSLPFIGMVVNAEYIPLITRLIEVVILVAGMYASIQVITTKIDGLAQAINGIHQTDSMQSGRLRNLERATALNQQAIKFLLEQRTDDSTRRNQR